MSRALQPLEEIKEGILCFHGCGKVAKYRGRHRPYRHCCSEFSMKCDAVKARNSEGGKKSYKSKKRKIKDYKSYPKEVKDRMAWSRGKLLLNFEELKTMHRRKLYLINERGHMCEICNLSEWLEKPISIEMDHVDGDRNNNTKNNLRLLCPNCHAQTDTWKGKNTYKPAVPEEFIIETINEFINKNEKFVISDILNKINLTPLGHNYKRIYKIFDKMGINYEDHRKHFKC